MTTVPDVRVHLHESKLLRGNPMGDPHVRRLPVWVPPGYDAKRAEPYPVVFLLAGWSGRGARYLDDTGAFTPSLPDRLDAAVRDGTLKPTIVVFPDAATKLGASQYVNSISNGPYMDYVCDELVDFVDAQYHTHRSRDFRGTIGHSSGGFGALVIGMLRPDRFSAIGSSAGDGWYEWLYFKPIPAMIAVLERAGGVGPFIEKFLAHPNPRDCLSRDEVETMMNLSMCACYAPNPNVPVLKGDLYFDPHTGELVPSVWKKFLDWDPVLMVDKHAEALKKLRWIHLQAGTDDEFALHLAHRQLAKRLVAHGIDHVIDEYPGKHGGHHWRMAERIRRMVDQMPHG